MASSQLQSASDEKHSDVLPAFVSTVEELLNGLFDVFPECDKVKKKLLKFRAFVKTPAVLDEQGAVLEEPRIKIDGAKMLIKDWHSQMSPFYDVVRRRDMATLFNSDLKIIEELDIRTKWQDPEFDQESRENLFQYIDSLNMYSQMYCSIPTRMLSKIEGVAQQLAAKMANGETNLASLDLFKIGESVIQGTSEEELMEFAGNMGEIQKMMQASAAHFGGSAGGDMPKIPGMPDLGLMMKMMGNFSSLAGGRNK